MLFFTQPVEKEREKINKEKIDNKFICFLFISFINRPPKF
ncbi:hypothetical protein JCM1393_16440 [Clostridium carnis]